MQLQDLFRNTCCYMNFFLMILSPGIDLNCVLVSYALLSIDVGLNRQRPEKISKNKQNCVIHLQWDVRISEEKS